MEATADITGLLRRAEAGEPRARDALLPLVYEELKRLSRSLRDGHDAPTLNTTALVHEAYLKLIGEEGNWQNRSQFFGVAARQMRRILVDHARKRKADKRAGGEVRAPFQDALAIATERPGELVAMDDALELLALAYPRQAQVVELRFYGGYTEDEIARILGTSLETTKRDWKFARVWLSREVRVRE